MMRLLEGCEVRPSNRFSTASTSIYTEQAYKKAYQIIDATTTYDEAYDFIKPSLEDHNVHITELVAIYTSRLKDKAPKLDTVVTEQQERAQKSGLLETVGSGLENWISNTRVKLRADLKIKEKKTELKLGEIGGKMKRRYKIARKWYTTGIEVLLKQ